MILVDTSVWVDHLRTGDDSLAALLNDSMVATHPFVRGELACANLHKRVEVLTLLGDLPQMVVATDNEVMHFIEHRELMGRGIGYVDAHLLAAVVLDGSAHLWTRDKRLRAVADALRLSYSSS